MRQHRYCSCVETPSHRTHGSFAPQALSPQPRLIDYDLSTVTTLTPLSTVGARSNPNPATRFDHRGLRMASSTTCQSMASSLRLWGGPPDSRSGDTVRLNASRRAGCEGARERHGSHDASLNRGVGTGACGENVQFLVQDFALGWPTRCALSIVCKHVSKSLRV